MKRPDAATISAQSTCWYRDTVRSCQRMIRLISATQAVCSSRSFHRIASPPWGFSTRAISWNAASASNQWNAWATVTTSTDASGSGIASAVPSTTWAVGTVARACSRMPSTGSTAVTVAPSSTRRRVSLPVPAARSQTVVPAVIPSWVASVATASSG